jgi:branched-chain amino acid transport system ATP-binding protein
LPPLIELHGVSKSFRSVRALDDVSLTLDEGEALGIVGPNGAGKSTLLNVIAGTVKPDGGRIVFAGSDITRLPGHRHCAVGISRTFQIPRPFGGLTAYENVLVAATFGRERRAGSEGACAAALEQVRLSHKANALARSLTLLERKRLELARAIVTEPRALLLDEIAGGLTEPEIVELVATVAELRARGVSVLWIEHIVHALLSVVDRLLALVQGHKLLEGEPHAVISSAELRDVYLGTDL